LRDQACSNRRAVPLQFGAILDHADQFLLAHIPFRDLEPGIRDHRFDFPRGELTDVTDIVRGVVPGREPAVIALAQQDFDPVLQIGDIRATRHQHAAGFEDAIGLIEELSA
jgi:hypothetical protein